MKQPSFYHQYVKIFSILSAIGLLSFYTLATMAQVIQPSRFEREQKGGDEQYTIISLKEQGLALIREKDKFNGNKKKWELLLLDTALNEKKNLEFEIDPRHPLIGYDVEPNHLYLLYRTGETNKNSLELINFNVSDGTEVERHEIKSELDFKITHFSKVGSSLALGGYVTNEPAILLYDMVAKNIKIVPGFFQKDTELIDLRVNQNKTFNTVMLDRALRSERKLVFKTFDEIGKLLLEDIIPIEEDRSLQASISSTLIREELVTLGTWGDKQGKQSLGFFSLVVDPFNEQKIKYFHFGELNHFLDYLNPKRAERIKANTKEDIQVNRRPSFTSYVIPFKIEEHPQGFLLLAEVYNPITNANPYYSTPYGNPYYSNPYYANPFWPGYYPGMRMYRPYSYGSNIKNADEIKTLETVLVSFDAQGKLLWDKSFKLEDIKKRSLEQVSDIYITPSTLFFLYKKESELKIKTIALENDTATESTEKIKLNNQGDEVRHESERDDGLKHWIGNSFYTWGYQTIRNTSKQERLRDVFYINKVVVN
jgi:hypothetical protein